MNRPLGSVHDAAVASQRLGVLPQAQRKFIPSFRRTQSTTQPNPHGNFYRSHGRALFKSLTLAFLSYQIFYWSWVTLETESMKDEKTRTIKGLEEEIRLLASGQRSHYSKNDISEDRDEAGKRLLDEKKD